VRIPLSIGEEILANSDRPDSPLTIQTEYRFSGRIDEGRLKKALDTAIALHPLTRARLTSRRFLLRPPRWEILPSLTIDDVRVLSCADESELDAVRARFYSEPLDVRRPPALRAIVAHIPGGDVLLFSISHVITDGVGSFRFLHSTARAYAGRPDPILPVDPLSARDLRAQFGGSPGPARNTKHPNSPTHPPDSLVAEGDLEPSGYGFLHTTLSSEQRQSLQPRLFGPGVTTNDLMMAALHLAIDAWNKGRGKPCDWISVLMPANIRPLDWYGEVVGNLTLGGRVTSTPEQRLDVPSFVRLVQTQTQWIKDGGGLARILGWPGWAYNQFPVLARVLGRVKLLQLFFGGDRTRYCAVLTYFGRLDNLLPDFGPEAGTITDVWGSPPIQMPTGLALGAGVYKGRLLVTLRYHRALLDDPAARRFIDLYVDRLVRLGRDEAVLAAEANDPSHS
jgi:NRPS condensation-like uncharacterized protein